MQTLWALIIFTEFIIEHSAGGVNFVLFVIVCAHL